MNSLSKLLVAIVLAGAMSNASATAFSFGINLVGNASVNTGNITALTATKTINPIGSVSGCLDIDAGACALAGLAAGDPATFSTAILNTTLGPDVFTLSAGTLGLIMSFTTVDKAIIVASGANSAGSISLQYEGTITSGAVGLLGQTVTLSQTCTQSSTGAIITCSESLITPGIPVETPEPMSLALVGMGLVALGFVRRKRA